MSLDVFFKQEALPQLGALRSFAYQLCRDEESTDDLVQETMLKACRYFHTYEEGTNCRAWLFQICKNSYINQYRRKQYEPVSVDFQEDGSATSSAKERLGREVHASTSDVWVERAHADMLSDDVDSALREIPPSYQTALILSDIEGYTYEEVAEFMQVPIGTIRSRIHRGRKMLANRLAHHAQALGYDASTVMKS